MFRVIYLGENGRISHKGGFASDKAANDWIKQNHITAVKLTVWSEDIQCFRTLYNY